MIDKDEQSNQTLSRTPTRGSCTDQKASAINGTIYAAIRGFDTSAVFPQEDALPLDDLL
jgi:hypothetical protein